MVTSDEAIIAAARKVDAALDISELVAVIEATSAQPQQPGAIGLAARLESEGVAWYLLAGDDSAYADADALARAFVWPSYARGRRSGAHLATGEAFADAVMQHAPGGVIVLLSPIDRAPACAGALSLMLATRSRRPSSAMVAPRPIGRVLRDFEHAVARQDVAGARALLSEAWATGRLSLVNRSFLQTRLLASQLAWEEVVDHAARHRLADLDLPRVVEHDLVRSLYWAYLHEELASHDIGGAISAFLEKAQPAFGDVFRDHRRLPDAATRRAWLVRLAALGRDWPVAMRGELLEGVSADDRAQLEAIAAHVRFVEPTSPEEAASVLLAEREDAAAFALAQRTSALPERSRAGILVQAAARLDDPSRLGLAAEVVDRVGGIDAVPAPVALVERIAAYPQPPLAVDSWSAWLQAVFEQPDWPNAIRVAEEYGDAWTEAVATGVDALDDVEGLIEASSGEEALRMILPRLVRAVIPAGERRAELARARQRVMEALAYAISEDPAVGVADLDCLADLLAALLEAGLSSEGFDRIASEIETVWRRVGTPPRLGRWVVDVLTTVTTYPCPDETRRSELVGALMAPLCAEAARGASRVHVEVWAEVKDILEGSELVSLVPSEVLRPAAQIDGEVKDDFAHLENRSILLHTLVPGAAERAAAFLHQVVPSARVITDDSHVGSDRLREQARRADVVVLASRAAKHAASEFIRRESSGAIAWASGKGWSSLVEALRQGSTSL